MSGARIIQGLKEAVAQAKAEEAFTHSIAERAERLAQTLEAAGKQFRHYETLHLSKQPPDDAKAKSNADWAENCESAVAAWRKVDR